MNTRSNRKRPGQSFLDMPRQSATAVPRNILFAQVILLKLKCFQPHKLLLGVVHWGNFKNETGNVHFKTDHLYHGHQGILTSCYIYLCSTSLWLKTQTELGSVLFLLFEFLNDGMSYLSLLSLGMGREKPVKFFCQTYQMSKFY